MEKRKEKKKEKPAQVKETVPYEVTESLELLPQLREFLRIVHLAQQVTLNFLPSPLGK